MRKFLDKLIKELDTVFTFIVSLSSAYGLSMFVRLKVGNPENISNVENFANGWNPENNYIKIIFIIVATILIFLVLQWLKRRFAKKWFRLFLAIFATLSIFVGTVVPHSTVYSLDPFHAGEHLAPSLAYYNGEKLFTEIFTLHGAGVDILSPNFAFSLLNGGTPSIGVYVFFTSALQTLAVFMFFLIIARLIKSTTFFQFVVLYFVTTIYAGIGYEKSIFIFLFIPGLWYVLNRRFGRKLQTLLFGGIGLIASVGVLVSYDVGVIMIIAIAVLGIGLLFLRRNRDGTFSLQKPTRTLELFIPTLSIVAGGLIGQLVTLLFLGGESYLSFIQTLLEITRYQGLMFDYPVSGINLNSFTFWIPIIALAISAYILSLVVINQFKSKKQFTPDTILAIILFIMSLLYLRFGVGRPDIGHIAMAAPVMLLTGFYIVQTYFEYRTKLNNFYFWPAVLFVGILIWPALTFEPLKLFSAGNTVPGKIKEYIKLPSKPDNEWLTNNQREVTEYIQSNSKPTDGLYMVDPEPLYYYTTNRHNPSRFAISWFADPDKYTNELLASLKADPPRFIIYESSDSSYKFSDGVLITDRIPAVNKWILDNYKTSVLVGGTTILSQ